MELREKCPRDLATSVAMLAVPQDRAYLALETP
jgi:hypothetical protein